MFDFTLTSSKIENEYEAVIIGGGPGGLTGAIYLSRALVKTLLIEGKVLGGNVILTSEIENYPGFESITGSEFIERLGRQIKKYNLPVLYENVTKLEIDGAQVWVKTSQRRIGTRTVLIATGTSYRTLGVPGETELVGKGVSYCATCDGMFFKNKVIALVGGGDSALKESLYLARIVKKIYLIHRRHEFRAERIIQQAVNETSNIEPILGKTIVAIKGKDKVEAVIIKDVKTGGQDELVLDGVFINIGNIPATDFVKGLVDLNEHGYIVTDTALRTNIKNIFAAGDVRVKSQRQIATAVGDGALAAASIEEYLGRR